MGIKVTNWSSEEDAILTKLWLEGIDSQKIANHPSLAKNKRTRNGVISRAHRLHLPPHEVRRSRVKPGHQIAASQPRSAGEVKAAVREKAESVVDLFPSIEVEEKIEAVIGAVPSILALRSDQCRFPIGDVRKNDLQFCTNKRVAGGSYCPACAEKAYQKPAPARRFDLSIERLVTKEKTLA